MTQEKILVVDDSPDVVRLLSRSLARSGYEVVSASNGEEALEKVRSEKPDLVVLDIEMPRMDGYAFVRRLKKDGILPSLPVMVLTAYVPMQDMFEREGVNDYFIKSLGTKGFLEAVRRNLKKGKAARLQTAEPETTDPGTR